MTPRQKDCYDFVLAFWREHGFAPSYSDIRDGLEVGSKSGVARLVSELVAQGVLRNRPYHARSLIPVELIEEDRARRVHSRVVEAMRAHANDALGFRGALMALHDIREIVTEGP